MDAIQALKTRRSVRVYTSEPVPRSVLEDIVDCARLAPTAMNAQPWDFVVVTEPEKLRSFAETTGHAKFLADAPACVVVLSKETEYYLEDCSAATENLLLAATAHGVASCWVAGEKQAYAPAICRQVGAPEEYRCVAIVSLGYPAEQPQVEKRPLSDVLHWGTF